MTPPKKTSTNTHTNMAPAPVLVPAPAPAGAPWVALAALAALAGLAAALTWAGAASDSAGVACRRASSPSLSSAAAARLALFQEEALRLMDRLRAGYGTDERTLALDARWNKRVLQTDEFARPSVKASFNKTTGCLYMRLSDDGTPLPVLRGIMLHELAHAAGTSHDAAFREAWLFFARVATEDLGYEVNFACPLACSAYGVCFERDCPRCGWAPDHDACVSGKGAT